jgi:hypothetical protein
MSRHDATFVLILGLALSGGVASAAAGDTSSPAQAEIRKLIDTLADAERHLDIPAILGTMHEQCRNWDLSARVPQNRLAFKSIVEEFAKTSKIVALEMSPLVIDVVDDSGIAYIRYKETIRSGSGADVTTQGSVVASVIKRGGRWVFLGLSWTTEK